MPRPMRDLTGRVFGRLTVVARAVAKRGKARWTCVCACGTEAVVRAENLLTGRTQSCGCLRAITAARLAPARNRTHGLTNSPTYRSWRAMRNRCVDPAHPKWRLYGGAGVKVCERWLRFENFLADVGERPEGKTLDRYPDPAGNYEPGNVRWATPYEQRHNRRKAA